MSETASSAAIATNPEHRHDFVLLFDVRDGNPNGDPDAGNLPRIDPETMQGLVTDAAVKRKVRDFVDITRGDGRYKIYVQHGQYLADRRKTVFEEHAPANGELTQNQGAAMMCAEFFDVRMFGAVMSLSEYNAGQLRGPMQVGIARSIDAIAPIEFTLTAPAQNRSDVQRRDEDEGEGEDQVHGTLGRKAIVPYALYRAEGIFNPAFARKTGADSEDLEVFWTALQMSWDLDRSAARGEMSCRGLYVFSHESPYGNAPAQRLSELIRVPRSEKAAPREFGDYSVEAPPEGQIEGFPAVTLTRIVG